MGRTTFNAAKPADKYFGDEWKPLLADAAYAKSLPGQPEVVREGREAAEEDGRGRRTARARSSTARCSRLRSATRLTLDFARAAIAGEELGQDDAPDILVGEPVGPRLREPRLQRRVAPLARPCAAARLAAAGFLPRPRRDGRHGQLRRRAHGRPRLHARARVQPRRWAAMPGASARPQTHRASSTRRCGQSSARASGRSRSPRRRGAQQAR